MSHKTADLLKEAVSTIRALRHQNEFMRARLDMFDDIKMIITAQVQQSGMGYSPDVCHAIEVHLSSSEPDQGPVDEQSETIHNQNLPVI